LLDCQNGHIRYTYRDRADGDRRKTDVLPAEEFLHRFLQHVLPDPFFRIRHYGLLANCVKEQRLTQCRRLLGAWAPVTDEQPHSAAGWLLVLLGIDITRCPQCGGPLHGVSLPRPRFSPPQTWQACDREDFPPWDTS